MYSCETQRISLYIDKGIAGLYTLCSIRASHVCVVACCVYWKSAIFYAQIEPAITLYSEYNYSAETKIIILYMDKPLQAQCVRVCVIHSQPHPCYTPLAELKVETLTSECTSLYAVPTFAC